MRKDYLVDHDAGDADESAFVERYWTEVWKAEGGPKGAINKVPKREEFRFMAPYISRLPKASRLLDGGCGLGDWTLYFDRQGFMVRGLDISRDTIARLRERFPDTAFSAGDVRDTKLPEASIDAYFSWGVFEHFEDGLQPCIREARRILAPGGLLFASVPYDNLRHGLRDKFGKNRSGRASEAGRRRFYQWRLTRDEFTHELTAGGFEVIELRPIHKRQGILRSLHHEFGLPYDWLLTKGLSVLLQPLVPSRLVAHMLIAVARKPL